MQPLMSIFQQLTQGGGGGGVLDLEDGGGGVGGFLHSLAVAVNQGGGGGGGLPSYPLLGHSESLSPPLSNSSSRTAVRQARQGSGIGYANGSGRGDHQIDDNGGAFLSSGMSFSHIQKLLPYIPTIPTATLTSAVATATTLSSSSTTPIMLPATTAELDINDDVFFATPRVICITDGVSYVRQTLGIDGSETGKEFIKKIISRLYMDDQSGDLPDTLTDVESGGSLYPQFPQGRDLVNLCYKVALDLQSLGSFTFTMLTVNHDILSACTVGDCGWILLRSISTSPTGEFEIVRRSESGNVRFGVPYQVCTLVREEARKQHQKNPNVEANRAYERDVRESIHRSHAVNVKIRYGDVLLAFSDGFIDNLSTEAILEITRRVRNKIPNRNDPAFKEELLVQLLNIANKNAYKSTWEPKCSQAANCFDFPPGKPEEINWQTPFSENYNSFIAENKSRQQANIASGHASGSSTLKGGKPDDITLVVSVITQAAAKPMVSQVYRNIFHVTNNDNSRAYPPLAATGLSALSSIPLHHSAHNIAQSISELPAIGNLDTLTLTSSKNQQGIRSRIAPISANHTIMRSLVDIRLDQPGELTPPPC